MTLGMICKLMWPMVIFMGVLGSIIVGIEAWDWWERRKDEKRWRGDRNR